MLKVDNVDCKYAYVTPQCWVDVTGRFANGSIKMQKMFSQFDRNESGGLEEVIVMYH